jgi:acetolactate synthase-1/2/3 large subunit
MLKVEENGLAQAAELIRNAKRPVILAGHGIIESGAMEQVRTLAERAQIPVALTLLGLGGFPASHPLNLGMMGMHGESWVNHAIQEADLLIACGMRFDDRVTGTLATYATKAKEDSHRGGSRPRSTRTSRSMSR